MTVPTTLPAPRMNFDVSGINSWVDGIASADVIVAVGDFTGGASEDLFTLSAHGLVDGDVLHALAQTAYGALTGGVGTRCIVNELSSSTFQCEDVDGDTIENTAAGSVVFLKGRISTDAAELILSRIIFGSNDTTAGTVEDMLTAANGLKGAIATDTVKLLYKSAAGASIAAVDGTLYVVAPVTSTSLEYCQLSETSGGAVADTTADGTVVYLKTS